MPREQIFEQLEAAPAEPPVDVVRLRLLRNEELTARPVTTVR